MTLIRILLFLIVFPFLANTQASPDKKLMQRANTFVESYNDWAKWMLAASPYSPDFSQRVRQEWLKRELGQKFRRLELELERLGTTNGD